MYSIYAELRDKRGLTDYSFAKASGVGRSILSDWKTGKHTPNNDNLIKIANFLGVSLDYLLTGDNNQTKSYNSSKFEDALLQNFWAATENIQQSICVLLGIDFEEVQQEKKERFTA